MEVVPREEFEQAMEALGLVKACKTCNKILDESLPWDAEDPNRVNPFRHDCGGYGEDLEYTWVKERNRK